VRRRRRRHRARVVHILVRGGGGRGGGGGVVDEEGEVETAAVLQAELHRLNAAGDDGVLKRRFAMGVVAASPRA
jgi:hypothetical protein